jgi:hypothetical protein
MPTTPFGAVREANLKTTVQGGRLALLKQWQDAPQFFCCISGNTVGVDKDPVPVLTVDDRVVCINTNVTVDFSLSWSPTDSLAGQPYTIDWGDGSPDTNGNFPNPRNAAAEAETYVGGYAAVGFYDITIEVQDSLGATASYTLQVYARDCSQPANPLPFPEPTEREPWAAGGMIAGDAGGEIYYTTDFEAANPTWAQVAGGSLGYTPNDIRLKMEPAGETMYVCSNEGIHSHPMPPDAGVWTTNLKTALNMADAAEPSEDFTSGYHVRCVRLEVSYEYEGYQWCLWQANYTSNSPATDTHTYVGVAHTRDNWASIAYSITLYDLEDDFLFYNLTRGHGLGVWQHDGGQYVYASVSSYHRAVIRPDPDEESKTMLYKSSDYGASWSKVDEVSNDHYGGAIGTGPRTGTVFCPYMTNAADYVYWAAENTSLNMTIRKSANGGGSFSEIYEYVTGPRTHLYDITGPLNEPDIIEATLSDELGEYIAGMSLHGDPPSTYSSYLYQIMGIERAVGSNATALVGVGTTTCLRQWDSWALGTSSGKTGIGVVWGTPITAIGKPELREYHDWFY